MNTIFNRRYQFVQKSMNGYYWKCIFLMNPYTHLFAVGRTICLPFIISWILIYWFRYLNFVCNFPIQTNKDIFFDWVHSLCPSVLERLFCYFKGQVTFLKLCLLVMCMALIIPRFFLLKSVFRPKNAFIACVSVVFLCWHRHALFSDFTCLARNIYTSF